MTHDGSRSVLARPGRRRGALSACGEGRARPPHLHLGRLLQAGARRAVSRARTRCRVVIDTFDSNEAMYAKLKAGASGYDLLTPSSYMVSLMHAQGMLRPLDHALAPEPRPCRSRIPEDRDRRDDGPLRPLHDHQHGHRLPQEPGRGLRAVLGDVRPGRPQGPDDHAQRHARDDRGRAQVPGLQPQHDGREGARPARDVVLRLEDEHRQVRERAVQDRPRLGRVPPRPRLQRRHPPGPARRTPTSPSPCPGRERPSRCDDLVIPETARRSDWPTPSSTSSTIPPSRPRTRPSSVTSAPTRKATASSRPSFGNDPAVFIDPELRAKSEIIADLGAANALYVRIWDEIKSAQ